MSVKFTTVRRGYDPSEVDQYIENLEAVIRNYKEKDSAINNALISAQVTAGSIIQQANDSAGAMKASVIAKLEAVTASLSVQKTMVKQFQDDYNALVQKYLHEIDESEILSLYARVQDLEEYIDGLSADGTPADAEQESAATETDNSSGWL